MFPRFGRRPAPRAAARVRLEGLEDRLAPALTDFAREFDGPVAGQPNDFGASVATDGDLVVIGQPQNRGATGPDRPGVAYVYRVSTGELVATLRSPQPLASSGNSFGRSVAISGHLVVVGASADSGPQAATGQAYVFDVAAGPDPAPLATLSSPILQTGGGFGWSVALDGTVAVVGTYGEDEAFAFDVTAGPDPAPLATLYAPITYTFASLSGFGRSVAVSGHTVVVGAAETIVVDSLGSPGLVSAGRAYVYDLDSGPTPAPTLTLNSPDPAAYSRYGSSVAVSGSRVVVGESGATSNGSQYDGLAYAYNLAAADPGTPTATLVPTNNTGQQHFGTAVAVRGTTAAVGAPYLQGYAVYLYDLTAGVAPAPTARLIDPPPPGTTGPAAFFGTNSTGFGGAVGLGSTYLIVGGESVGDTSGGAAFVFGAPAVAPPAVVVSPVELPLAAAGTAYSQVVSAAGPAGPYSFAVAAGALPGGLTLAADGTLSGTPTTAGTFAFTVTATAADGSKGDQAYSLPVGASQPPVSPPVVPPTVPPVVPPTVPPAVPPTAPPAVPPAVPPDVPPTVLPVVLPVVPPAVPPSHMYLRAVGADVGGGPRVRAFAPDGTVVLDVFAFEPTFTGGVRVATGDVNGDGTDDVIAAAGDGGGPRVVIFDGRTGGVLRSFFAFDDALRVGAFVAVADADGDGAADYAVTAGAGGGSRVALFDGPTGRRIGNDFFAFDPGDRSGYTVALGDVNGDGRPEIAVGQAADGARIRVFGVGGRQLAEITPFDPDFLGGVNLAVGDYSGDGSSDLVVGAGDGGGPLVRAYRLDRANSPAEVGGGMIFDGEARGGVRVGSAVTSAGGVPIAAFAGRLRSVSASQSFQGDDAPFGADYLGGVYVS